MGISVKNKTGFGLQSNFTKFLLLSLSCNPPTRTTTFHGRMFVYKAIKLVIIAIGQQLELNVSLCDS